MIKTLIGKEYEVGKTLAEGTNAERLAMNTEYLSTGSIFIEIDNGGKQYKYIAETKQWYEQNANTGASVTYENATTEKDGLMSKEDKTKLDGVAPKANNYTHPSNHPATIITEDATHKFITEAERTSWNAKSNFSGSYNDLTNKPTIPTKVSQLTNDSSFLTSVPAEYITETELNAKGYVGAEHTHTQYVEKVEGKVLSTNDYTTAEKQKLNGLNNYTHPANHPASIITQDADNRFCTDTEKGIWNGKSDFSGSYNDLTNKPTIPTKTSQLTNDSKFLISVPAEYITETELDAKGYLTQHQDISGKQDKIVAQNAIADLLPEADLPTVITTVNSILATLRTVGIIENS